jgi:hypothetical protein
MNSKTVLTANKTIHAISRIASMLFLLHEFGCDSLFLSSLHNKTKKDRNKSPTFFIEKIMHSMKGMPTARITGWVRKRCDVQRI